MAGTIKIAPRLPITIPEIAIHLPDRLFFGLLISPRPRIPKMIAGMPVIKHSKNENKPKYES